MYQQILDVMKEEEKKIMEDIDEAEEETLSLFEYSIDPAEAESQWEDYSTSVIKHEEHYFDFCSDEWSATAMANNAPENIIFCGKIIRQQEPTSGNAQNCKTILEKRQKRPGVFQWRPMRKDHSAKTKKAEPKSLSMSESRKFSVHKISILASPRKFRWYLLFGMTRFPTEMALRDIKNRQSRRIPSSPLFRMEGAEKKEVNNNSTECKSRGQGLWRQLRRRVLVATTKQTL